jgi:hypothetical protein
MVYQKGMLIISELISCSEKGIQFSKEIVEREQNSINSSCSLIDVKNCNNIWHVLAFRVKYAKRTHRRLQVSMNKLSECYDALFEYYYSTDILEVSFSEYTQLKSETEILLVEFRDMWQTIASTYAEWKSRESYIYNDSEVPIINFLRFKNDLNYFEKTFSYVSKFCDSTYKKLNSNNS